MLRQYGVHSISTGHIYGLYYTQQDTQTCKHPTRPLSESLAGSDYKYRECARKQDFHLNVTLLEPYVEPTTDPHVGIDFSFALRVVLFLFWRVFFGGDVMVPSRAHPHGVSFLIGC